MNATIVRRLLLPSHEWLMGRRTLAYLRELERSQWLSRGALREIQERKLQSLLAYAARCVPFYAGVFSDGGLRPGEMSLNDLVRLPAVNKELIRREGERMVETPVRRRLFHYSTGGSGGDPLIFKIDRNRQSADQAARARTRQWFGVPLGERELYLWGAPVELAAQDRLRSLRDRLTNQLLLNAFEMTPVRMTRYLRRMHAFDPVHLFGYPSSLARLVRHARKTGQSLRSPSLRAVFVTGELLSPGDRALLEEDTGVPVADGYGSREAGFIAHQCPEGRYHVTMESVLVELLDPAGNRAAKCESGEVTVTHLDARGMPFIRYRTGDRARWSPAPCPCGRNLETLEGIEGRQTDMLRTVDGGYAHALSVIYVLREMSGILQFRVEQAENLDLKVTIVGNEDFDGTAQERVMDVLRRRIGEGIRVTIERVDAIPITPSGKHRCVVSHAAG